MKRIVVLIIIGWLVVGAALIGLGYLDKKLQPIVVKEPVIVEKTVEVEKIVEVVVEKEVEVEKIVEKIVEQQVVVREIKYTPTALEVFLIQKKNAEESKELWNMYNPEVHVMYEIKMPNIPRWHFAHSNENKAVYIITEKVQ